MCGLSSSLRNWKRKKPGETAGYLKLWSIFHGTYPLLQQQITFDPLGYTHGPASSDHYVHLNFVLFVKFSKV